MLNDILRVFAQLCTDIDAMHKCGVLHADIKCDNLFYAQERIIVADFSHAMCFDVPKDADVSADALPSLTKDGELIRPSNISTVLYSSTELILAEQFITIILTTTISSSSASFSALTTAVHVYSLGLVLFELITWTDLQKHIDNDVPKREWMKVQESVREYIESWTNARLPREEQLKPYILKMLDKNPTNRRTLPAVREYLLDIVKESNSNTTQA